MDDPFLSPRTLLDRAGEHAEEMDRRIISYLKAHPIERRVKLEFKSRQYFHSAKFADLAGSNASVVVMDVVNALRSALDHAVYASSVVLEMPDPRNTKFPFGDTLDRLKGDAAKCHPLAEMRDYLIGLKGHKDAGGDVELWCLNKLRNVKNHRALLGLRVTPHNVTISRGQFSGPVQAIGEWNAAGDEYTYLRLSAPPIKDYELTIAPSIQFCGIPELERFAAMGWLPHMRARVAEIVTGIENKTAEIIAKAND